MIDIIIPCYNAQDTLGKTLDSIAMQQIKDKVNVLLVDDCSKDNYEMFLTHYSKLFPISCLRLDHNSGAGVAREKGILNTYNPYIVFIDSDDRFFDSHSLKYLFEKIEEGYDYVNSLEYDEKKERYILSSGNIHGKIYRRSFIQKEKIHFNETRYHEDNYFNNYVILSGAKLFEINRCTYYYTYNKDSITNKDSKEFERLEIYLKNMNDLLQLVQNKNYDMFQYCRYLWDKYRYLYRIYYESTKEQQEILREWLEKYEPKFLEFLEYEKPIFVDKLDKYLNNMLESAN